MMKLSRTDISLLVVYLLLATGLGWLSVEAPPHVISVWLLLILTTAGIVALAYHRCFPVVAFAAAMVLTLVSFAAGTLVEGFLVLAMLYLAGARHSARAAWVGFVVVLVAGAAGAVILARRLAIGPSIWGSVVSGHDRDLLLDWANNYVIIGVTALVATLLGVNVGHRRRYVAALVSRAEQMERERDQQAVITSARERERIAREMHDVIAHSLAVMIAMADGAHATALQRPEAAKQAMGRVADTGRRTLDEVHRLLGSMRGDDELLTAHQPQPDAFQMEALIAEFQQAGLPVHLTTTGTPPGDHALGLTVYRIVQESLTNALRHARHTRRVTVEVSWTGDGVDIMVEDHSAPTAGIGSPGRGLLGMRERAALYDGQVTAGPRAGGGWRVHAHLPTENNN